MSTDPDIRTRVLDCLTDDYPPIRQAVIDALVSLVDEEPLLYQQFLQVVYTYDTQRRIYGRTQYDQTNHLVTAFAELAVRDATVRTDVIALFSDVDWRQRWTAAEILHAAGEDAVREALPQLMTALEDQRGFDSWPARIAAAELLLNRPRYSAEAVATILPALDYDAASILPVRGAAVVRKQAALALSRLKAIYRQPEVAERIVALMATERDPQVLDGFYNALLALDTAPEEGAE